MLLFFFAEITSPIMEYYLKGDYIMIGIFFRSIIVTLMYALLIPTVFFGLATVFVGEFISRIVYAESAINEVFDLEVAKEAVNYLLKATKEYILG